VTFLKYSVSSESSAALLSFPSCDSTECSTNIAVRVWAINAIELEGYNLEIYTKSDVLFVLWTQFLKQINFRIHASAPLLVLFFSATTQRIRMKFFLLDICQCLSVCRQT
jgi:hypothetical protein